MAVTALLVGLAAMVLVLSLPGPAPVTSVSAPTPTPSPTATVIPDPVIAVLASECAVQPPRSGLAAAPSGLQRCTGRARVIADAAIGPVHIWLVLENDEGEPFYACRQDTPATTAAGTVITWTFACDTDNRLPSRHRVRFTDADGEELPARDDRER